MAAAVKRALSLRGGRGLCKFGAPMGGLAGLLHLHTSVLAEALLPSLAPHSTECFSRLPSASTPGLQTKSV